MRSVTDVADQIDSVTALELCLRDWNEDETLPTGEIPRATAVMRRLLARSTHAYDLLCELAESVTYTVRRYGNSSYCWPVLNNVQLHTDPWPAVRFPKAVLCVSVLLPRVVQSERERRDASRAAGFIC